MQLGHNYAINDLDIYTYEASYVHEQKAQCHA